VSTFSDVLDTLIAGSGRDAQAIARLVPCDPAHISRLRKGTKNPSIPVAERLDEILAADGALIAAACSGVLPAGRPDVMAALSGAADPSATAELARRLRASEVDAGTLEALQATAETLCCRYAYRDPLQLRREAQQWLAYTGRLLGRRIGLREHRELLVTAGWLTLLAGCLEYDSVMAAAAQATRMSAYHLGREAGHAGIIAWALEMAAWFAHTRQDLSATLTYARAGQDAARGDGAVVQLIAHEARALARMGDVSGAQKALDRGHAALHGLVPGDIRNHFVTDPAKFDFYAMDVYRVMDDSARASEHAVMVIEAGMGPDGEDRAPMRTSEARLTLGCVAAMRGDLDEAAALGAGAFGADRKCLPQLLLVAGELDARMRGRYPDARPAVEFREQLAEIRLALAAAELRWAGVFQTPRSPS